MRNRKRFSQTPTMHTLVPTEETEIAYWWLRRKESFTIRQTVDRKIYFAGNDPENYPHLFELMPQNGTVIDSNALPESMRLGMILEAYSSGCEHPIIVEYLQSSRMLKSWIVAGSNVLKGEVTA